MDFYLLTRKKRILNFIKCAAVAFLYRPDNLLNLNMKYELSENFSKPEGLESFDIMSDLIHTKIRELLKKREDQILERLAQLGHTFKNEAEKSEFAKTRLTMHTYEDKPQWRELYLDKTHLIASWWETVDFDGNTIIAGKHPSMCGGGFEKFFTRNED